MTVADVITVVCVVTMIVLLFVAILYHETEDKDPFGSL